jgi:hypothetical protein
MSRVDVDARYQEKIFILFGFLVPPQFPIGPFL